MKSKLLFSLFSIISIISILFIDSHLVKELVGYVFFIQLILAINYSKVFNNKSLYFFSPGFLAVLYINLSIILGNYSLYNNLSIDEYKYRDTLYNNLENLQVAYSYILLCSWIAIISVNTRNFNQINLSLINKIKDRSVTGKLVLSFVLLIFFSVIKIDLSTIGGVGDFSTIPKTVTSIIIIILLSKNKVKFRFILYLFIFLLFVFTNFESKREAVFMALPMFLFETLFGNIKPFDISFKKVAIYLVGGITMVYLILVMTIARGYGGYPLSGPLDAINYVPNLIDDYDLISLVSTTSEAPTTTYHSVKAIELINEDISLLSFGSTYAKLLFIFLPKSIFDYKPLSMTTIFTGFEDSDFLDIGGSLPINFYAEAFWNFYFFGCLVVLLILIAFNNVYIWMIKQLQQKHLPLMFYGIVFAYTYIIGFYRGFGFDLYGVMIIVAIMFSIILSWGFKILIK